MSAPCAELPCSHHLQLECDYYMVLWQQDQAPFAKGYLSSGLKGAPFHHRRRAASRHSSSQHLFFTSLASCVLSWITCGGVLKQEESGTPGVFAAGSCPAPSTLSVVQPGRRAANTLLLSLMQSSPSSLLRASSFRPYVWSARPQVTATLFLRESLG